MPIDVEDEIGRLYGAPLHEFVPERTRLVKALRSEGRRAEATTVQQLRKPTLSAWTVNQLVRHGRKDVDLLLDAGHRLAVAQRGLLAGGEQAAFDKARDSFQQALRRVSAEAATILGDRASPAVLERVGVTLRAAAISDATRPELARGELTGDLEQTGFDVFGGVPPGPAKPRARREDEARTRALERARASLETAREREAEAAEQARAAERALRAAATELHRAERNAERLRERHAAAARAVEVAMADLDALG